MIRLTLLRHATSTWDRPDIRDFDRKIDEGGRREATLMGLVCKERLPPPDLVLVSPAIRTRETIKFFFKAWMKKAPSVKVTESLYLAGLSEWRQAVEEKTSGVQHLLVCSHQPGLGDFASWLCPEFDGNVPPATVISIRMRSGKIERNAGVLDFTGRPKDFTG